MTPTWLYLLTEPLLFRMGTVNSELLMGRHLRTTVPTVPSHLDPALPDGHALAQKEKEKRMSDSAHYNRRHCSRMHSVLSPGEPVWVTDAKTSGTVIQNHTTPRSYLVDLPQGLVRRNRLHLIPPQAPTQERTSPQQHMSEQAILPAETPNLRTRSGRAIIKPANL